MNIAHLRDDTLKEILFVRIFENQEDSAPIKSSCLVIYIVKQLLDFKILDGTLQMSKKKKYMILCFSDKLITVLLIRLAYFFNYLIFVILLY